mmetsp:Transcript_44552/g.74337  ORF Transcript_44552/g.74337 Transcript_44552/m.74337 type:complete len:218 (-) Transcript_44552:754-1407(-)
MRHHRRPRDGLIHPVCGSALAGRAGKFIWPLLRAHPPPGPYAAPRLPRTHRGAGRRRAHHGRPDGGLHRAGCHGAGHVPGARLRREQVRGRGDGGVRAGGAGPGREPPGGGRRALHSGAQWRREGGGPRPQRWHLRGDVRARGGGRVHDYAAAPVCGRQRRRRQDQVPSGVLGGAHGCGPVRGDAAKGALSGGTGGGLEGAALRPLWQHRGGNGNAA